MKNANIITRCLFPAAGYGTRFLPVTKAMPKEMLPVLTKPLIQYGVEEAMDAGCDVMSVITGRGKRAITDHFDISYELEHQIQGSSKEKMLSDIRNIIDKCTFTYTRQNEMKGLGDAIYKGKVLVGDRDPFAVILADDFLVYKGLGITADLVRAYEETNKTQLSVMQVDGHDISKYGVIKHNEKNSAVRGLVEKPIFEEAPSSLASIGRYILTPNIFDILRTQKVGVGGEIQLSDAINTQAKSGNVEWVLLDGKRFDCGDARGYLNAILHAAEEKNML